MNQQLKPDGTPYKILFIGDFVVPSGFGRICMEVCKRLVIRGWQLLTISLPWSGYPDLHGLPFRVIPVGNHTADVMWGLVANVIAAENPDVVVSCQDFPYAHTIYHGLRVDWSTKKMLIITPIDGTPINSQWLDLTSQVDGTLVISKFGVEAARLQGYHVDLLHPGVDTNEFHPAENATELRTVRALVGIKPDAFVIGSFMMNQGRKAVPDVMEFFYEFARDKPNAVLYLDMDTPSPAGWDIDETCKQIDPALRLMTRERVKRKEDAFKAGLLGLRERYLLCDISAQLAHREGFGLPNLESMACKVPPSVIDWCSGSEIAGGGKGILVRCIDYKTIGTWGGARDAFPDRADCLKKWNWLYYHRDHLRSIASTGYEWAVRQTWDVATDQFEKVLTSVLAKDKERKANELASNGSRNTIDTRSDTGDGRSNPPVPPAPVNPLDTNPMLRGEGAPAVDPLSEQHPTNGGRVTDGNTVAG